jgi:predicted CXXCH cytochrome family protein
MTGCISSRAQARPPFARTRGLALVTVALLTLLAPSVALALAAPTGLAVTSGNMADTLRWNRVRSSTTSAYRVERASAPGGPWKIVARRTRSASLLSRVPSARTWYYRLRTIDRRGRVSSASAAVSNATVSISSVVGAHGATLRASNGQMSLTLPAGAFASSTRVTVRPTSAADDPAVVQVTPAFDFRATSPLRAPASLTMRYRVPATHFQVAASLARAIDWMCWDTATGRWVPVPTTVDTAAGTFTAAMPHFSYWTGGVKDPHGTTKTDYCGDQTVCHALVEAPGSQIVLSSTDSQVCYNCHGAASVGPPTWSEGHNIQAEFFACPGQSQPTSMSTHPVRAPGSSSGLKCVSCHDPHADKASSPKLLRAYDTFGRAITGAKGSPPGTEYCLACHGARRNRAADALVSGYWTRTGDKQTTFNGAHTALGTSTWRFGSQAELKRGYTNNTEVRADGTVAISGTIMLPKTPAPSITATPVTGYMANPGDPLHGYDGLIGTDFHWYAHNIGANGANELNPLPGAASYTIDLGSATRVSAFECYIYNPGFPVGTWSTDVLEVQTSDDSVTWRTIAAQGTLGTRLGDYMTFTASDTCRYVRFSFARIFTNSNNSIGVAEFNIYGPPSQGTYEVWPDIARKATYSGGVVKWTSTEPASTSLSVSVRASTDRGVTWTSWQSVTNGGALTQIPTGASLENARLQVRSMFSGVGVSPILDSLEVSINRGAIPGTTPQWSGGSPMNLCQRCHAPHGSARPGLVADGSTIACKTCHSATYGSSYVGSAQFAGSKHAAVPCADCHTAHGTPNGAGVTYAFLLHDDRAEACLACHTTVSAAFDAKQGVASEWAKHDVRSAEQVKTGSTLACRNCHGTHFSSTGLVNPDSPAAAYTTMRDDPTSIPTGEVLIEASRDALVDSNSGQQAWNYGASTEVTITPSTRLLAYFDLSAIPASATIQNATLVLWGSSFNSDVYSGGYAVYRMTQGWLEGTGTGVPNDAATDGATWLEWKYGDNANTGDVASGDWAALGGDYASTPSASRSGINALSVTAFVTALRQGTNYGIMIGPNGATTSLPIYTRHNATAQYRPRLRVVYRTGPATRQVIDDITFCSKCHDGSMPAGVTGQSMRNIGASYMTGSKHGGLTGVGPESAAFNHNMPVDRGGGYLKPPYSYGMDALPCTTCHDPHGSRLPYHLRETLNGRDMGPLLASGWTYEAISTGPGVGYFCGACHVFPTDHTAYETMGGACFNVCHGSSH